MVETDELSVDQVGDNASLNDGLWRLYAGDQLLLTVRTWEGARSWGEDLSALLGVTVEARPWPSLYRNGKPWGRAVGDGMRVASWAEARERLRQAVANGALEGERWERARQALVLRYGLEDGMVRTYEEVGQLLGVTRQRVGQLVLKAWHGLRRQGARARRGGGRMAGERSGGGRHWRGGMRLAG